ncbi:MAG: protein kinase [Planctomycetota bacterium]|nr:protein kinase [Planctomycetota bacterium]
MKENRSEEQFGQLVVVLGFASPVVVSECIRVQKSLLEKGERKPLGQLLVERGILSIEQVRQVLLRQGMTLLVCKSCKSKFNLADPYSGDLFKCRICGASVYVAETPEETEEEKEKKSDLLIGANLAGCRITEQIGEDAVTRSYKAWQQAHQCDVVMRILKDEYSKDKELIKLFLKEAAAASKVRHFAIAPIYDVGQAEGYFYVCHGYVRGENLRERMEREGRPPVRRAVANVLHITSGMALAHKTGIVHRDIQPTTIIYSENKNRPVLTGLGFIKRPSECSKFGEAGVIFSPPGFMAPEQMKAYSSADARSDVFSLCAVLFYMLVGEPPFKGDDPIEVLAANLEGRRPCLGDITDGLPRELCSLVDKGLSRHPDQRYANAEELRLELEKISEIPLPAQPVKVLPRSPALEGAELSVTDEEKGGGVDEYHLDLAPLPEEELKLADEEPEKDKPVKVEVSSREEPPVLSEEEKAQIIEEIEKPSERVSLEEKRAEEVAETEKKPPLQTVVEVMRKRAGVVVLGGIGVVVLIVLLVLLLSGGETEKDGAKVSESEVAFRALESFVLTNRENPEQYEEILSRCKEFIKGHPTGEYSRKVGLWISDYESRVREERIKREWEELKESVKKVEQDASGVDEVVKRLEEFARKHLQHPLGGEAKKAAEKLNLERMRLKAEEFLTKLENEVRQLYGEGRYKDALALIERGMPPEFEQRRYEGRLREMRDAVLVDAEGRFGRLKEKAERLVKEGKIEEAIRELGQVEAFGIKSLAQSAEKEIWRLREEFRRKLWVRRLVVQAALDEAYSKAAEGDYEGAKTSIEEVLKDGLIKENHGTLLESMLFYLDAARSFTSAHLDYLKKQVGTRIELRTVKGILLEGVLERVDEKELQIGSNPPVSMDDVPYEKKCEFARLALGGTTTEAIAAEAAFRYFRGEISSAYELVSQKKDDRLTAMERLFSLAQFMTRVTRNRVLFNGVDTKFFKTTTTKLTVKDLEDEPEKVLFCEKAGRVSLKETVIGDYIFRFSFRLLKGSPGLVVCLPYDAQNYVNLEFSCGEGVAQIREAKTVRGAKIALYPEIWYDVEARFINNSYTVLLDGKEVLIVSQRPLFLETGGGSILGFNILGEGCILKSIQLLETRY